MFEKWDQEQTTVNPCLFTLDVRKAEMSSYLRKQTDKSTSEHVQLGLVHTSDGIRSGVGIGSARSVMIQCKSKSRIGSGVGSSTESEPEGLEEFLFLPIPLLLLSLPSCRFTLNQNFLPIPTRFRRFRR